jgi:hypothetical protein
LLEIIWLMSLLEKSLRFHCVVVEGVFDADGAGGTTFHEARALGPEALAEIRASVRVRLLRTLSHRNLLEREDAQAMGEWDHGGASPSMPACVSREKTGKGMERLLRYCARPAFALERLREIDAGRDEFDLQAQPAPDYDFDQRIAW